MCCFHCVYSDTRSIKRADQLVAESIQKRAPFCKDFLLLLMTTLYVAIKVGRKPPSSVSGCSAYDLPHWAGDTWRQTLALINLLPQQNQPLLPLVSLRAWPHRCLQTKGRGPRTPLALIVTRWNICFSCQSPRGPERDLFNYFFLFVKEARLYVELQCESAAEDVVTGSELVETHVDVPRLKVSLFQK